MTGLALLDLDAWELDTWRQLNDWAFLNLQGPALSVQQDRLVGGAHALTIIVANAAARARLDGLAAAAS